jgi:hypothetical protein
MSRSSKLRNLRSIDLAGALQSAAMKGGVPQDFSVPALTMNAASAINDGSRINSALQRSRAN